jgi:RHH-type rel operon transcriptional repressor/antitoxin RelB
MALKAPSWARTIAAKKLAEANIRCSRSQAQEVRGAQIRPLRHWGRPHVTRLSTRNSCITRMTEAISVRLPEDIANRLDALAKSLERPKTYIVTKALREYLEEYEDYLVALHRLKDKNDRVVSEKELVRLGR